MHISTIFVLITILLSSQYLAVSAQSTPDNTVKSPSIENSPCENDWDCVNNNNSKIEMKGSWFNRTIKERPGDFMCIQKTCKFVVAAGQPCRDETDCIAYHYSIVYNVNVKFDQKDFCSPKYCNPESSCDGAWDQKDLTLPHFEKPSNCCNGLPSESKCDIIANDVDPCDYSSSCVYDKTSGSAKCFSEDRKGGIWIGIVICLLGGVAANIGLNVQKYAFTKHQDELNKKSGVDDDVNSIINLERSSLYRKLERFMFWKQIIVSPLWVFGLGIYIFGSLLGFVALKFAPQSLVAPLGVVSLVVNLIIAPILHHQKLTIWDIVGVVIIICGSIVITVFSGIVIQDYKLCALIGLFHRIQTIVYLSTIAAFICALFTFIRVIERNAAREDEIALAQEAANIIAIGHENSSPESTNVNESSLIEGENGSSTVVTEQDNGSMDKVTHTLFNKKDITDKVVLDVSNAKHIPPTRNSISSMRTTGSAVRKRNLKEKVLLPLAYAILASSLATITTLFAKSLVNLLTISFVQKDNQFKDLLSWMILLITISTAIGQVYWINMGLKKYDALLQVPIFYCNWSLFDIIGGGIYYDEFHHFTVDKYVGFIVGICLIFFGVSLLSKRLAMLTKEEEKLKEKQKIWEQEMKKKRKVKNGNNRKNLVYDEKKKVKS